MAAANLSTHLPIIQVQNKANTTPFSQAEPEAAGQNFLSGSPVQLNASGFVQQWDGTTIAAGILGVSESFGLNLGTAGAGAPAFPWGGITGSGAIQTYGSVPNQPLAVNVALGTPVSDGRTLYMEPNPDNIFEAILDNSSYDGVTTSMIQVLQTDIGKQYGMTKDANGYWYVDKGKATAGTNTIVQIVGYNKTDGNIASGIVNGRVQFFFIPAAVQIPYGV